MRRTIEQLIADRPKYTEEEFRQILDPWLKEVALALQAFGNAARQAGEAMSKIWPRSRN